MYEATLRIDHSSPYATITRDRDVNVEMWCNQYCDLVYVSGDAIDASVETLRETVGVQDIASREAEAVVITETCLLDFRDDLLEEYLQRHRCLSLPPLTYSDGALFARILALTEQQLTGAYHDLNSHHRVTVESKRELGSASSDVPLVMLDSALPTLSDGQERALSLAVDAGYYEIPRETTTAELAGTMGVSRRTFEEHLRRAENKIIKNLLQYFVT